jgi:hypothetical protein
VFDVDPDAAWPETGEEEDVEIHERPATPDYYAPILGAVDGWDNDEPWMSVQDGSHEPPYAPQRDVDDEWLSFGIA